MWCSAPLNAVLGQNLSEKPINGITPRSGFREKDKDGYSFSSGTWVPHYSKIPFFLFCYFIMTPTFRRTRYTKFRAGSSNEKPRLFGLNILKRVLKWRFLHVFATRLHAAELFFANAGLSRWFGIAGKASFFLVKIRKLLWAHLFVKILSLPLSSLKLRVKLHCEKLTIFKIFLLPRE